MTTLSACVPIIVGALVTSEEFPTQLVKGTRPPYCFPRSTSVLDITFTPLHGHRHEIHAGWTDCCRNGRGTVVWGVSITNSCVQRGRVRRRNRGVPAIRQGESHASSVVVVSDRLGCGAATENVCMPGLPAAACCAISLPQRTGMPRARSERTR